MYDYLYLNVELGGGLFFDNSKAAHREVIARQAEAGWRYVGFVPTGYSVYGRITSMDLVFERELEDGK